jgi:hypothetical protein
MPFAPSTIDGAEVLLTADIGAARRTGRTRHVVDGAVRTDVSHLAIARYPGGDEVYLFSCDDAWEVVTDTCHDDVREALDQARFEYDDAVFARTAGRGPSPPGTAAC